MVLKTQTHWDPYPSAGWMDDVYMNNGVLDLIQCLFIVKHC